MKILEAQGFSKQKALETTGLDVELDRMKNATQAWKKAGAPMGTKALNEFFTKYIKEKKAVGAYVVVDPSSDDTRTRPYKVINEVTQGKRKSKTFYQIKEAEMKVKTSTSIDEDGAEVENYSVDVLSSGAVEGRADRKEAALKLMKTLIETNKKPYVIEIVKEVVEGQKFAAYGLYTPSKSAKMGKFLFCAE
jgi:hypothetical protein